MRRCVRRSSTSRFLRVVGIVDARQSVIFIGYRLAFLGHVGCLLACHVAPSVVCECGLSAGRVVHLRAAVAHVIRRGRHIAVSVCYTYKSLDAVVSECGNNVSVRTAFLYALQRLSAAARMGFIQNLRIYIHGIILVTRSITSYLNNRESQFKKLYNCTIIIANIEISFYFSIWKYAFLRIHIWCNNYFIFS